MIRTRLVRTLALAAALIATGPASTPALAQEPAPPGAEGEGSGRPLDGYLATLCLAGMVLFVVGKSARR
jgi:hypothetical protein